MKITNRLGLPEAIVKAVVRDPHNKESCLSATTLLKGTREIILTERYRDEITADAADMIWALFGSAAHKLLESEGENEFAELRLEHVFNGVTVTGFIDNYDMKSGVITDWKTASVWKVIYRDYDDWNLQGQLYAWLLSKNGFSVRKCRFVALLKDHSKTKAGYGNGYPKSPVYVHEFDVGEDLMRDIESFIKAKTESYRIFHDAPDERLPECSPKERWSDPDTFAVMKAGRKTAVKLCDSYEEAESRAAALGPNHYVEKRPGSDRKCEGYCLCREFCSHYKETKKQGVAG
jgi:hypothetical protein